MYRVAGFSHVTLDVSDLPTRHNCVLGLPQARFEEILASWVGELGSVDELPGRRGRDA